jgi:hypothetical protein
VNVYEQHFSPVSNDEQPRAPSPSTDYRHEDPLRRLRSWASQGITRCGDGRDACYTGGRVSIQPPST